MEGTLKIVNCTPAPFDLSEVISGVEPVGYLGERFGVDGFPFILRDNLRHLAVNHALFVVRYPVILLSGKTDYYWVLCVADTAERYNRLQGEILSYAENCRRYDQLGVLSQTFGNDSISAVLMPIAFYSEGECRQAMGMGLPNTSEKVYLANAERLAYFFRYPKQHCYLGNLLGTNINIGLILRHFGSGQVGWDDARMMGVFGATGSGKTRFAAQVIAGYAAYGQMGILILDPQGQFGKIDSQGKHLGEIGSNTDGSPWHFGEALRRSSAGRNVTVIDINQIAFSGATLFVELLKENSYFKHYYRSMSSMIQADLVDLFSGYLDEYIQKKNYSSLSQLVWEEEIYENTKKLIISRYASGGEDKVQRYVECVNEIANDMRAHYDKAKAIWECVLRLFSGTYAIHDIIDRVLVKHEIIIVSLATLSGNFASDRLKKLYCAEILDRLRKSSENYYHRKSVGSQVNALVVIDEAQRLSDADGSDDKISARINQVLIDAVRTTRKLNLGWMFITQSLRALDKEIFRQLNTKVFGFGLAGDGQEEILKTAVGNRKDTMDRYRTMPIPKTSGIFPFLVVGEMLPLGNGSYPIFMSAFNDQTELFATNPYFFR